jgi:hypothetical protein
MRRSSLWTRSFFAVLLGMGLHVNAGCSSTINGPGGGGGGDFDADIDEPPDPDDPDADIDEPPDPEDPDADIDEPPDPEDPDADVDEPPDPEIDAGPVDPTCGLGAWDGKDNVAWSQKPPCNLPVNKVPQFVSLGFDDNGYSGLDGSAGTGGFSWSYTMVKDKKNKGGGAGAGTFDNAPVKFSYYLTTAYVAIWQSESPTFVKRAWHQAFLDGHDMGNHTQTHSHGAAFSKEQWASEIQQANDWIVKPFDPAEVNFSPDNSKGPGIPKDILYGYRTPFLEYNDKTFTVLLEKGFRYDTSVEEGYQEDIDGRNFPWPFTLDNGSPGNEVLVDWMLDPPKEHMTSHKGLWELSPHPVIVPPDNKCAQYGLNYSLRNKMHTLLSWWDPSAGKVTGLDYNLWVQFQLNKAEWLAVMKYTLDERLAGNRAPFMFGMHTDIYSSKYTAAPNATPEQRQQAVEEFIDYALSKPQVRFVSNKQILDWVRNPVPLP